MSQAEKSRLFKLLKDAGVEFSKHYREYTEAELAEAVKQMQAQLEAAGHPVPSPEPPPLDVDGDLPSPEQIAQMHDDQIKVDPAPGQEQPRPGSPVPGNEEPVFDPAKLRQAYDALNSNPEPEPVQQYRPPVREKDPNEEAGVRLNTQPEDEPIRTDEQGRVWYQEEVLKPAFPKPRGRRVLRYNDPGVKQVQASAGEYTETFEVAGDRMQQMEARITLPSYQVGVYRDPRFPFKIHTYNGVQGFDFAEVARYYGGTELVPPVVKRMYVENVLCYDIRTVVRAIQEEFRQLQLLGKV